MTDTPEDILARELIETIKSKMSPRAVILEDRIEKCLAYLDAVTTPNLHTLNHARRCLMGENDEWALTEPGALMRGLFEKRWRCEVFTSGFHNNATCTPSDPHGGRWSCEYRWIARPLTEKQAREFGLTVDITEESA